MIPDNRSQQGSLPPTIFLMGPTASGKTDLAIELCRELPCEIISVDSAMVYRGMDIGTAKPSPEELALAPHRLGLSTKLVVQDWANSLLYKLGTNGWRGAQRLTRQ